MHQVLFVDVGCQNVLYEMLQMHHILLLLQILVDMIQSFHIKQDLSYHAIIAILVFNVYMMMEIEMQYQEVMEVLQSLYQLQFLLKLLLLLQ